MPEIANIRIIASKIDTLERLGEYLLFSLQEAEKHGAIGVDPEKISIPDGNVLAAFRMRFSEFQEQLGKLLRSIAIQEDFEIKGNSSLAAFAEKFEFTSEDEWNRVREIRNNLNHDYDGDMVAQLTVDMQQCVPLMIAMLEPVKAFCRENYNIGEASKVAHPKPGS